MNAMRTLMWLSSLCFIGMQFSAKAETVPGGTQIQVRPNEEIRVSEWDRGRIYTGNVARDVLARDGDVAIPRGAAVELIVRQIAPGRMAIDLESITVQGRRYALDSSGGPRFNTGEYANGGGLLGAIVGAVTGARTEGGQIFVPPDGILTFETRAPLRVVDWGDPGYERDGRHYHREPDWY